MKLELQTRPPLASIMAAEIKAGERAATAAARESGDDLKQRWRSQITRAGLGQRLGRTVQSRSYPRGATSIDAATLVWTNAPEIVGAFDRGVTIRSRAGFWLAIPTDAAGRGRRGGRITPGEWEQRTGLRLRFVYRRGKPSFLVAEGRVSKAGRAVRSRSKTGRGVQTIPIFILVPQVRLRKRLDLARDAEAVQDALAGRVVDAWVSGKTGGR